MASEQSIPGSAPRFGGVLETVLYHEGGEREAIEAFYRDVLGLDAVAAWEDGIAFRAGAGVLLLFDLELLERREDPVSDHGARGPGHACLRASAGDYERWLERLRGAGVEIAHEHEWGGGGRSFYFRDPAGNLLEIADRDLWPGSA